MQGCIFGKINCCVVWIGHMDGVRQRKLSSKKLISRKNRTKLRGEVKVTVMKGAATCPDVLVVYSL